MTHRPVFGITGWKNAGKTTLVERLVAEFVRRGFRVATIKHAHHDVEIDQPGRDSFRHRAAGAVEVALVGGRRYAIMREQDEPTLAEVLARLSPADLILIEGYKREPHPKIEVCGAPGPSLAADDPNAAWYVYFYFGYPKTDDMGGRFSVRCVRSDRSTGGPTKPRYEVRAADITDPDTGLRWQRAVSPGVLSFDGAQRYCARLDVAGRKRWRVPTLGELLTLIDERAKAPMIDRVAFPETPGEPFWSSSTFANGKELAWYVRFDRGDGLYGRLSETFRVRCVQ